MKKIYSYIFGFILICITAQGFADTCDTNACSISDAPSPLLTEYLESLSQVSDNIIQALGEREEQIESENNEDTSLGIQKDISATKNRVLAALNSILSFKEHYGSFDFWISLGITNEIPAPIKRDHKALLQKSEKLTEVLKKSSRRGSISVQIKDVCSGVTNCNIPDAAAGDILATLIKNNNNIIQLFQSSVLEKPALAPNPGNIILVSNGFETEIKSKYNKDTLAACSLCEDGTLANFREKIQNISFKNSEYEQGVATWKAAWAMLRGGNNNENSADYERQLLSDYLQGQGINTQQADIVLGNLDRYNETGLSSSDPLTNSYNYTQANIQEESQSFQETLLEKFNGEEKVPFVILTEVNAEVKNTEDIQKEIHTLFEDQKPFSFVQDSVSQELQARILRIHFSLVRSINMLSRSKSIATQACEEPGGGGRCDYSN